MIYFAELILESLIPSSDVLDNSTHTPTVGDIIVSKYSTLGTWVRRGWFLGAWVPTMGTAVLKQGCKLGP